MLDYGDEVRIKKTGVEGIICDIPKDNKRGIYIVDAFYTMEFDGHVPLFEATEEELELINTDAESAEEG